MSEFAREMAEVAAKVASCEVEDAARLIGAPKDKERYHYAMPCFALAKGAGMKPPELAGKIADALRARDSFSAADAMGPFLNVAVRPDALARSVMSRIARDGARYGGSDEGAGRAVVLDYGSPNIAKRFHIGHLRSTVIGAALSRLFAALGYRSVGVNHLGDWGTQFGHLLSAWERWGDETQLEGGDPIGYLQELYVRHNKAAKEDPSYADAARAWFKKLEDGDETAKQLWQRFRDISMVEFDRVYALLGVKHDEVLGESFYADTKTDDAIRRCEEKGIAVESDGALVIDLKDDGIEEPLLLKRSDGATLYATRDVAAGVYRFETYDPAKIIYVIGQEQRLAMRQLFAALAKLGYDASRCHHVWFGRVLGMSSRAGTAVLLDEVLGRAIAMAKGITREANADLTDEEVDQIAEKVGIGAVVFADLKNGLKKDFDFDWERIVQIKGDTGPYLQYTHARLCSIERKLAEEGADLEGEVDWTLLGEPETQAVLKVLEAYPDVLRRAADNLEPQGIAQYLLELASALNLFYKHHRVKDAGSDALVRARARLVRSVRTVLGNGLRILGLEALERM